MLSIIAAMSEDRVIGRAGTLPWHLPADLKRFKALTCGHAIIMGRKTFESIGRPLPERTSIVMSNSHTIDHPRVITAHNLDDAVSLAPVDAEVFVIGGSKVFEVALPHADRMYLTLVHTTIPDGDVYFPAFDEEMWNLICEERVPTDEKNEFAMTFRTYDKRRGGMQAIEAV